MNNRGLIADPLFVGATRPPMRWGVTYSALLFNMVFTMEAFLLTKNLLTLLVCAPIHGVCMLLCARDARFFDLVLLVCGNGLVDLYGVLCDIAGQTPEPLKPEDISARANANSDPLCVQVVETFVGIFGSVAGDLVLTLGAWDGVYLTGGLVPILLPWMERGNFRERFEAKGRFRVTMEQVPTQAIMNPEPGLMGAAALALVESGESLLHRHG